MKLVEYIEGTQTLLNYLGASPALKVDGDPQEKSQTALAAALAKYAPKQQAASPTPVEMNHGSDASAGSSQASPGPMMPVWIKSLLPMLGWTEYDHDKQLAAYWPVVGLSYKTVIGLEHAWCGLIAAVSLYLNKLKFPKDAAGASSWSDDDSWSDACEYICGAFLPLRHAKLVNGQWVGGGRHITIFLYWVDKVNKIAACLGGNQGDTLCIKAYNLSGNRNGHDEVVGGPRFPKGVAQTGYVWTPGQEKITAGGKTT